MPAPHTDRRPDAKSWATEFGWKHTETIFEGEVIRDVFTKGDRELRCVWLRTPFSDAMWARGYLLLPHDSVTVPRVTSGGTRPSVETVLKLQHKHTKGL
jgi:hypothetical protein